MAALFSGSRSWLVIGSFQRYRATNAASSTCTQSFTLGLVPPPLC